MRRRTLPHCRPIASSTRAPDPRPSRCNTTAPLPTNVGHSGSTIGSSLLVTRPPSSRPSLSFLSTHVRFVSYKTPVLHAAA
ncbi:hypothetical protein GALMADRAFT_1139147 [Galerina marginata CBS 339.88]|uniref:Uncharacterized protein n=1 Tax=Galerina marginata (strain CBS 339.88) TaxID=685588 RepID=A0A067SG50_GALM3|nr:hypothetical protein GALMADRAFT_1139147 [Galerina marginata CBS 339.88]